MKLQPRVKEEPTVDLTSLIDVVFLLLIFFMVTTRLTEENRRREIRLPTAMSSVLPENLKDRDTINIDENSGNWKY